VSHLCLVTGKLQALHRLRKISPIQFINLIRHSVNDSKSRTFALIRARRTAALETPSRSGLIGCTSRKLFPSPSRKSNQISPRFVRPIMCVSRSMQQRLTTCFAVAEVGGRSQCRFFRECGPRSIRRKIRPSGRRQERQLSAHERGDEEIYGAVAKGA